MPLGLVSLISFGLPSPAGDRNDIAKKVIQNRKNIKGVNMWKHIKMQKGSSRALEPHSCRAFCLYDRIKPVGRAKS